MTNETKTTRGEEFIKGLISLVDYDIYKDIFVHKESQLEEELQPYIDHLNAMYEDSEILDALRGAGVDNWDGWDIAMESLEQDED